MLNLDYPVHLKDSYGARRRWIGCLIYDTLPASTRSRRLARFSLMRKMGAFLKKRAWAGSISLYPSLVSDYVPRHLTSAYIHCRFERTYPGDSSINSRKTVVA